MVTEPSGYPVIEFETNKGARIFQIPLKAFPGLSGYAYLVRTAKGNGEGRWSLIDTGSGFGDSNRHLEVGFQNVSAQVGYPVTFNNLSEIFITHAHIDHMGGLPFLRPQTQARLGVHELDRRNITHYDERLVIVARRLGEYLVEAGVPGDRQEHMLAMYQLTKSLFRSVEVDFTYEAEGMRVGEFEFLHVPGHCAGHVAIRLHDVIFTGDHILAEISPHQAPERLTLSTGLDHYLKSLDALLAWAEGARLILGGHRKPVTDLPERVREIKEVHRERLAKVLEILAEPHTIDEVAAALFGEVHGYNELLAVEEAGAHVEYLYQRGRLEIANLREIEQRAGPGPVYYRCSR